MPRILPLASIDDCLLWRIDLAAPPHEEEAALLSDDEHARAARFVFERDRRRFVAARSALRVLLGEALGRAPGRLQLAAGPQGKPFLADLPGICFNLSHSADVGVLALDARSLTESRAPIGVDVEVPRPVADALAIAQGLFEPEECAELAALEDPARSHAFLIGWTRKEACLKAMSSGFSGPCHVATGLAPVVQDVYWCARTDDQVSAGARVHSFELPDMGGGGKALGALARMQSPAAHAAQGQGATVLEPA